MLSPLRKSLSCCEVIDIIVVVVRFTLERYGAVGSRAIKAVHNIDQIEDGATYRDEGAKILHLGGVNRLVPNSFSQELRVMYLALLPGFLRHEEHIVYVYSKDIAWQTVNLDYLHFAVNKNRPQKYKF